MSIHKLTRSNLLSLSLLLTILLAAGCRPSTAPGGSLPQTAAGGPTAGPAPAAQPGATPDAGLAFNQVLDISFSDATHGWLIGSACGPAGSCAPALRLTLDGGLTWQAVPAPPTGLANVGDSGLTHNVRSLRFNSPATGWAFGPGLWATRDGGRSWADLNPDRPVRALEPAGGSVWALFGSCQEAGPCEFSVAALDPGGLAWQPLPKQPGISGTQVQLLRYGPQDAWVLAWGSPAAGEASTAATTAPAGKAGGPALAVTHDGGASWQLMGLPCSPQAAAARMAALNGHQLWALCGGGPGAGQQLKTFTVSNDGGLTWSTPQDAPSAGYVDDLAAVNQQRGFMALGRSTLFITHYGGQSWTPAIPLEQANPSDSSGWRIVFFDELRGWASLQNRVFRTSDGGEHWSMSEVH
ncbi:MAG TPA: hypothetical protein VF498_11695 [Anaerolineales bacterium]